MESMISFILLTTWNLANPGRYWTRRIRRMIGGRKNGWRQITKKRALSASFVPFKMSILIP
jgi:hypothetical protein